MKNKEIKICIIEEIKLVRTALKLSLSKYENLNIINDLNSTKEAIKTKTKADIFIISTNSINDIRLIKSYFPSSKTIVLYSGEIEKSLFNLGINGLSYKNIDIDDLHKVIELINRGGFWFDENIAKKAIQILSPHKTHSNIYKLTTREQEVLKLVAKGFSNTQIANILFISAHTAKVHVSNILNKLEVTDRVQAAIKAYENDMLNEEDEPNKITN